jgi:hypothetical protein
MLSFKQFLNLLEDFKGWTSPSGNVHLFKASDEHAENHHPEFLKHNPQKKAPNFPGNDWYAKQIKSAQKKGFVRFGKAKDSIHGQHAFVHYDGKHPSGHAAALHTLKYLNLDHNEPVSISDHAGSIHSARVRQHLNNRVMTAAQAMRHLHQKVHGVSEANIFEDDDDYRIHSGGKGIKGWMSPSGKPHLVPHEREHKEDHHPEYLKHHNGKQGDQVQDAQSKGFVRFGGNYSHVHGNHHYVHYDKKHPKGRETAIKALQYMKPHHDDPVTVSGSAGIYDRAKGKRNATAMRQLGSSSVVKASQAMELLKKGKSTTPKVPHAGS